MSTNVLNATQTTTLVGATATDLLSTTSAGFDPQGCDCFSFEINNAGANTIESIQVWGSAYPGATILSAFTPSLSLATTVKGRIGVVGYRGGNLRLVGTSAGGSVGVVAEVSMWKSTAAEQPLAISINGIASMPGSYANGTVSGAFAQSGGTATIAATGAVVIDGDAAVTIAGTTATSMVLGRTAIVPSMPGGVTIAAGKSLDASSAGALNVGTSTATSIVVGKTAVSAGFPGGVTVAAAKALDATSAGALNIGPTTATSIVIGAAAVAPSCPGGITVAAAKALDATTAGALNIGPTTATSIVIGAAAVQVDHPGGIGIGSAKAITGVGAMTIDAGTAKVSLGTAASSTSTDIGRAGNVTSLLGTNLLSGVLRAVVADAGAAAASGTANGCFTTFTIASGQTGYVLTNSSVATTSLVWVGCISGAVGRTVFSAIPTLNTVTVLLSGAAAADSKFACLIVNV